MRNVLYPKLAATNIKKNGKTYFPYLLTCILTVMMFYDLLLVSTNSALDTMPGYKSEGVEHSFLERFHAQEEAFNEE